MPNLLSWIFIVAQAASVNTAPQWAVKEIDLGKANRSKTFEASVPTNAAADAENDSLRFNLVEGSGPAWLRITKDGQFFGTPTAKDRGAQSWRLTVRDAKHRAPEIPVKITIENRPPTWKEISLPRATEEKAYRCELGEFATDPDGDKLRFSLVKGPAWLQLTEKGRLQGTPPSLSYGSMPLVVQVADRESQAETTLTLVIEKKKTPPEFRSNLIYSIAERSDWKQDLAPFAKDRNEEERLRFSLKTPSDWVQIDESGILSVKPKYKHLGKHLVAIQVNDGQFTTSANIALEVTRDPRPPTWAEEARTYTLKTREPFKASVAALAKDLDGISLTFKKGRGPEWLQVSPNGELMGTPNDTDKGKNTVEIIAANDRLSSVKEIFFTIEKKNYPPQILQPLQLTLKERENFTADLRELGLARDEDGESLLFVSSSPPSWLSVSPKGLLSATPEFAHIGVLKGKILVKDSEAQVELPTQITVVRNPRPPVWKEQDWTFSFLTRELFQTELAPNVRDLDGRPIHFSKVEGPDWLLVTTDGKLSATPQDLTAGTHTLIVRAQNDVQGKDQRIKLKVTKKNYPPTAVGLPWKWTIKERETSRWRLDQAKFFIDPDGDRLQFILHGAPPWVTLETSGELTAKPVFKDIGSASFKVEARDRETTITVPITLQVERDPRPPSWKDDQLVISAKAREGVKFALSKHVEDLDGLPLKFSKVSGPEWLNVSSDGTVSGQAGDEHVGEYSAAFAALNDLKYASVQARIQILFKNHPPTWIQPSRSLGTVRGAESWSAEIASMVKDVDAGDKLSFEKVRGPSWVLIDPSGKAFGRAPKTAVGSFEVAIRVVDSANESADWSGTVEVTPALPRPTLGRKNLELPPGYVGELFVYDFKRVFNQKEFRYRLTKGPTWMKLRSSGEVGGIPDSHGDFDFALEVTNGHETEQFAGRVKISPP